jgi:hypothetical protein
VSKFQNVLLAGLLIVAGGCSSKEKTVLSGDTAFEMRGSIMRLAQKLPADRRDEFERAVETVMLSTTDRRLSADGDRLTPQAMLALKGRTANQVIENAKLIRSASGSL